MAIRTTIDIPEPLHAQLKQTAERSGTSIRSLIITAVEQTYQRPKLGKRITGPMITGKGKLGPRFPVDENPHDLILP